MKRILFLLLIGISSNMLFAQDIIVKQNGDEIKSKILEITSETIKYKEFDFQDGPTRNINISDVFMVIYENGKREKFIGNSNSQSQLEEKPKNEKHKKIKKQKDETIDRKGFSFLIEANPLYLFFLPSRRYDGYTEDIQNIPFSFFDYTKYSPDFSFEAGIYSKYNLNNFLGVKSGVGVMYYKFKENLSSSYSSDDFRYEGDANVNDDVNITYLQIPIGLTIIIGKRTGFYTECGFLISMPINSSCTETYNLSLTDHNTQKTDYDYNSYREVIDSYINTTINSFLKIGISIPLGAKIRINVGPYSEISLNEAYAPILDKTNSNISISLPERVLSLGFDIQFEIK